MKHFEKNVSKKDSLLSGLPAVSSFFTAVFLIFFPSIVGFNKLVS